METTVNGTGLMDGFVQDLWEAAKVASPFATMYTLILWWLERTDRVRLQRERDALLERVLTAMNAGSSALQEAQRMVLRRD